MELIHIMKSINLKLCSPREPTRIFEGSKSCIDHVYSKLSVSFKKVYQTSITDHFFVYSKMIARVNIHQTNNPFRDYKNLKENDNQCQYNLALKQLCSDFERDSIDLDEGFRKLAECIIVSADKFAPMKRPLLKKEELGH